MVLFPLLACAAGLLGLNNKASQDLDAIGASSSLTVSKYKLVLVYFLSTQLCYIHVCFC